MSRLSSMCQGLVAAWLACACAGSASSGVDEEVAGDTRTTDASAPGDATAAIETATTASDAGSDASSPEADTAEAGTAQAEAWGGDISEDDTAQAESSEVEVSSCERPPPDILAGEPEWLIEAPGVQITAITSAQAGVAVVSGAVDYLDTEATFAGVPVQGGFVAGLDEAGQVAWMGARVVIGWSNAHVSDAQGNVYAVGLGGSDLQDMPPDFDGSRGIYLIKYGADGRLLWAHTVGTESCAESAHVVLGDDGALYVSGTCSGEGPTVVGAIQVAGAGGFVAKLDLAGNGQWIAGPWPAIARSLAADADGEVSVSLFLDDLIPYGGGTLGTYGDPGSIHVIAHLDATGAIVWGRDFDGVVPRSGVSVAFGRIATDGKELLVHGSVTGGLAVLGGFGIDHVYAEFIARLSHDGEPIWVRYPETEAWGWSASIGSVLADGSLLLVGAYNDAVVVGGTVLPYDGRGSSMFARMDEQGALTGLISPTLCFDGYGQYPGDVGQAAVVGPDCALYLSGTTRSGQCFGQYTVTGSDVRPVGYLVKYAAPTP